jgi:pilus assembly protein FimV
MPSDKFTRAPMWCALSLAFGIGLASPAVDAAGLGRLSVQSGLGQPLRAELEVTSVGRDEAPTLAVRLAPPAAFRAANLEYNAALTNLRFALDRRTDGNYVVRISSAQPVNEPYLDVMIELTWATGRVIREYTVLLDPPALKSQPDIVAPAAPPAPVAAAPLPAMPAPRAAAPAPAPTAPMAAAPAPAPSPAPAPKAAPAPSTASGGSYTVKSGDTLGKIANQNRSAASLDQMLVALFRANPEAFINNNMNLLRAGAQLSIPSDAEAAGVAAPDARKEVVAQSADFAAYRSRLAQAAGGAAPVAKAPTVAAGGGQVTTKVEDRSATAKPGGDQLKIAKADDKATAAAAAAAKADEAAAKQRALKEEQERAAQLKKTNEAIQKALEVQSKAGAQAQKQAEQAKAAPAAAPPAPAVAPPAPAPAPVAAAPAPTPPAPAPAPEPMKAEAAKAEAPVAAAPAPAPAPAPVKKAAPPPPPPAEEPGFMDDLLGNTTTQLGLAGIVALLAGLFGWSWYRKRKAEGSSKFKDTEEGLQANSLFGATGGQSVDTGTSTFNSSFIPAASQLDSNEVDPVAEADVYIAYGREEQAEDILKEALRMQPDRHAVRVKLLEIFSRRGDKASFMTMIEDLRERTGGAGEDWEKAIKLGHAVDPNHPMFAGAAPDTVGRGPSTGFRLDPNTKGRGPSTLGGGPTSGLDLGGLRGADSIMDAGGNAPPLTKMVVDTRMTGADTTMSVGDTKMPADTKMSGPMTTSAPTTQFRATLPGGQPTTGLTPPAPAAAAAPDFASLDFDLGPTKMNLDPPTKMPTLDAPTRPTEMDFGFKPTSPVGRTEPPALADLNIGLPPTSPVLQPTATGAGLIPDLDLNIPSTKMPTPVTAEALSRPTVIGKKQPVTAEVGSLPDEQAQRLTANTDQATVPLIDFDLSAVSLNPTTKRGETEPGSALAQQMATKLDLARGYIDLGVKDGARELLDEVMRDGTREQRQAAVELIKQIEG